jgi:hypothetical protein
MKEVRRRQILLRGIYTIAQPMVGWGPTPKGEAPFRIDVVFVAHDDGCLIQMHRQPADGYLGLGIYGGLEAPTDKIEIDEH